MTNNTLSLDNIQKVPSFLTRLSSTNIKTFGSTQISHNITITFELWQLCASFVQSFQGVIESITASIPNNNIEISLIARALSRVITDRSTL